MAEDRQAFKDTMERIGEPCIASKVVNTVEDALDFAKKSLIRLLCVLPILWGNRRRNCLQ